MSGPDNSKNTLVLLVQVLAAGGLVLIAFAALYGAYWVYQNPETPGWVMGVGGYEIILVGIAVVAVFYASKKSPLQR